MRTPPRGLSAALAAAVGLVPLSLVVTGAPAQAAPADDIRINEIITNSPTVDDAIELTNIGSEPVDVGGWIVKDDNDTRTLAIAPGTTVAPGAFVTIPVDVTGGFGLGNGDSARIFLPDGVTLVDGHAFPGHSAPSWSRCPDGTGEFVQANSETLGAANDCPTPGGYDDVVINEVRTNPNPDFVELKNTGDTPIVLAGLQVADSDHDPVVITTDDTPLAPGELYAFDPDGLDGGFGLGGADEVTIFLADGTTVIDTYAWTSHRVPSYGRCVGFPGLVENSTATPAEENDCPAPAFVGDLVINEVKTNPNPDFVELKNVSDGPLELSGLMVADNANAPVVITTESTTLAPGALFAFNPDAIPGGFGLGAADTVTVLLADGVTVIDSYAWTSHRVPSYGRCPDGDGMVENAAPSPGAPNVCQPIRINEVESNQGDPGDWVELVNVTSEPFDVTGWVVKDSADDHAHTIPATPALAGGEHLVIEEADLGFGLGGEDAVRLFRADGTTLVDSHTWTSHASTTYGRCADGVGDFVTTRSATKGAANDCPPPFHGVETQPWPGSQDITLADPLNAFVSDVSTGDVSGLAFDPNEAGVLWAIKNKNRLFKLTRVDGLWTPLTTDGWDGGKELKFADGNGEPDTEGVTVGPDGAIYATSERDNVASNVARNTVLRYDPTQPGPLTATDEWDLTDDFPELLTLPGGSNLGFEGLTWVPDSYLVANGFVDPATGQAYDPAAYPGHGAGLFFTALENDGQLYAYALGSEGATRIAVVPTGFPHVMDVTFDEASQRIWAACDDTCDGQVSLLEVGDDGHFTVDTGYDRPTGMPNLNNEGFAIAPADTCADGFREVVWADDAGTGGNSLRASTLPCADEPDPDPDPDPVSPSVTVTNARTVYGKVTTVDVAVDAGDVSTQGGAVVLTVGAKQIGTGTVGADGTVAVTVPALAMRPADAPYTMTAQYAGVDGVEPATGTGKLTVRKGVVQVRQAGVTSTIKARTTRATVRIRVTSPDGVPVRGTVTVSASGLGSVKASVVDGTATVRLKAFPAAGTKTLAIRYNGSALVPAKRITSTIRVTR